MNNIVEDTYKYDNVTTTSYTNDVTSVKKSSCNPIVLIVCFVSLFLLCISLYRTASGLNQLTFSSFLSYLQNIPKFTFPFKFVDLFITDGWGFFDFLRNAINLFIGIFSVLMYFATSAFNLIRFVVYSLGFFFV